MSIEAMKQALEALEQWNTPLYKRGNVIKSLRQAIAEAEQVSYSGNGTAGRENMTAPTGFFFQMPKAEKQEPVLWQFKDTEIVSPYDKTGVEGWSPLYTHPQPKREWVGLTDDDEIPWDGVDAKSFARAIEAKLKEKNT